MTTEEKEKSILISSISILESLIKKIGENPSEYPHEEMLIAITQCRKAIEIMSFKKEILEQSRKAVLRLLREVESAFLDKVEIFEIIDYVTILNLIKGEVQDNG